MRRPDRSVLVEGCVTEWCGIPHPHHHQIDGRGRLVAPVAERKETEAPVPAVPDALSRRAAAQLKGAREDVASAKRLKRRRQGQVRSAAFRAKGRASHSPRNAKQAPNIKQARGSCAETGETHTSGRGAISDPTKPAQVALFKSEAQRP